MNNKEIKIYGTILSFLAAILLIYAIGDLEYGYYQFLRVFVTFTAIFNVYVSHKKSGYLISIISGAVVIVFNPFAIVVLQKSTWRTVDVLSALYFWVFAITLWIYKDRKS